MASVVVILCNNYIYQQVCYFCACIAVLRGEMGQQKNPSRKHWCKKKSNKQKFKQNKRRGWKWWNYPDHSYHIRNDN